MDYRSGCEPDKSVQPSLARVEKVVLDWDGAAGGGAGDFVDACAFVAIAQKHVTCAGQDLVELPPPLDGHYRCVHGCLLIPDR